MSREKKVTRGGYYDQFAWFPGTRWPPIALSKVRYPSTLLLSLFFTVPSKRTFYKVCVLLLRPLFLWYEWNLLMNVPNITNDDGYKLKFFTVPKKVLVKGTLGDRSPPANDLTLFGFEFTWVYYFTLWQNFTSKLLAGSFWQRLVAALFILTGLWKLSVLLILKFSLTSVKIWLVKTRINIFFFEVMRS